MPFPAKVIRDAVHGDVEVSREELALLDTPAMQRLRGIKQLGLACLVYPSAVHTRFEHALGTLAMTAQLLARLGDALSPDERRVARIAALLHDVTHIPFGHTLEDERRIFERHDVPARTLAFLRAGALAEALDRTGLRAEVEDALAGEPARPVVAEVVRGTIGADLLDYLRRDALFCGLRQAYDERLLRAFAALPDAQGRVRLGLALAKRGLVRADLVTEVMHLLRLRYTLCERVYFHHAKVAAGAMVSRAVELAVNRGLGLEDLFPLRDETLFAVLRARFASAPELLALLDGVELRRLYKRAYVLTRAIGEDAQARLVATLHRDRAAREALERELADAAGLAPEEVIVSCPEPRMASKEADIPVQVECGGPAVPLTSLGLAEVDALLERHRDLWRFHVLVAPARIDHAPAVARAAAERLGHAPSPDGVG